MKKNDSINRKEKRKNLFIWLGIIVVAIILIGYPLYVYNYCSQTEVDTIARQTEAKNQLSQLMSQTKGADKVLTREEEKLIEVMVIAVSRYENMDLALSFINEQNLQVSPESYQQVRQILEIYYSNFYAQQTILNDMVRTYDRKRATAIFGFVSRQLGFPTQEYIDARIDEFILEDGVQKTYDSEERTMPEIPMSSGEKETE